MPGRFYCRVLRELIQDRTNCFNRSNLRRCYCVLFSKAGAGVTEKLEVNNMTTATTKRFIYNRFRVCILCVICVLGLHLLPVSNVLADSACHSELNLAQKSYRSGNFGELVAILRPCIAKVMPKDVRIQSYRLLALTDIAMDLLPSARGHVVQIIALDSDFKGKFEDPSVFKEMLARMRTNTAAIVSASKLVEPLNEVPVPVTLITSEMIENIGAKTLKDILITYVPGIYKRLGW